MMARVCACFANWLHEEDLHAWPLERPLERPRKKVLLMQALQRLRKQTVLGKHSQFCDWFFLVSCVCRRFPAAALPSHATHACVRVRRGARRRGRAT